MTDFETRDYLRSPGELPPLLTIVVGCSRTGKTTWVNAVARVRPRTAVVSRDDIRRTMGVEYEPALEALVEVVERHAAAALLRRGYDVILDGTHLTRDSRRAVVDQLRLLALSFRYRFAVVAPPGPDRQRDWRRACEAEGFKWSVAQRQLLSHQPVEDAEGERVDIPGRFG